MKRVGVFVDAGYLFAAGSALLTGSKKPRQHLTLRKSAVIEKLKSIALEKTENSELLRIYWYDGAEGYKGQTGEQADLAYRDDIKLRLGLINSHGQQKGVDSLIVTDLIELSRKRAIQDAILLSGDEDVRVGVQLAQNYGVRVHLVGIDPCRSSQSNLLMQEADTCSGLDEPAIGDILEYQQPAIKSDNTFSKPVAGNELDAISKAVENYISDLSAEKQAELKRDIAANKRVSPEHDGRLLAKCRELIDRDLTDSEKLEMRSFVRSNIASVSKSQN